MNTKQQGDIGVAVAIAYYTKCGHVVSVPLTDNSRYDLVVEMAGVLKRIQVKTTKYSRDGIYEVALRTNGGNQSWSGMVKKLSRTECDLLFVYAFDDTMYEFPPEKFDGKATLSLGKGAQIYRVC